MEVVAVTKKLSGACEGTEIDQFNNKECTLTNSSIEILFTLSMLKKERIASCFYRSEVRRNIQNYTCYTHRQSLQFNVVNVAKGNDGRLLLTMPRQRQHQLLTY